MAAHHVLPKKYLIKRHLFGRYTLLRRALRIPSFGTKQIKAMGNSRRDRCTTMWLALANPIATRGSSA